MSIRRIGTLLTALAMTGCASGTEPDQVLDVSVVLSADVVHPGEYVDVTVTATNRGARSVTVNGNPCQGALGAFVVTNGDGDVIGPGEMLCSMVALPPTPVAPGEQIVLQAKWDGDSQRRTFNGPPVYLDPGEYQVRGQILTSSGRALSAPASVRVVERL